MMRNCLSEACHGMLMDRFLPARPDLLDMLDEARAITAAKDFYRIKRVVA